MHGFCSVNRSIEHFNTSATVLWTLSFRSSTLQYIILGGFTKWMNSQCNLKCQPKRTPLFGSSYCSFALHILTYLSHIAKLYPKSNYVQCTHIFIIFNNLKKASKIKLQMHWYLHNTEQTDYHILELPCTLTSQPMHFTFPYGQGFVALPRSM